MTARTRCFRGALPCNYPGDSEHECHTGHGTGTPDPTPISERRYCHCGARLRHSGRFCSRECTLEHHGAAYGEEM